MSRQEQLAEEETAGSKRKNGSKSSSPRPKRATSHLAKVTTHESMEDMHSTAWKALRSPALAAFARPAH